MIVKCKVCGNSGKIISNIFDFDKDNTTPCPTCKGAGEYELVGSINDYLKCKLCNGTGKTVSSILLIEYFPTGDLIIS